MVKRVSDDDGRVTRLSVTEKGAVLSEPLDRRYFQMPKLYLNGITDEAADCMVRVVKALDGAMCMGEE